MSYKTKALGRSDTGQKKQLRAEILQSPLCVQSSQEQCLDRGAWRLWACMVRLSSQGARSVGPENVGLYEFGFDPEKRTDDVDQEP